MIETIMTVFVIVTLNVGMWLGLYLAWDIDGRYGWPRRDRQDNDK